MTRALVTGGAGFIGANLSERLLNEGKRVVVLDNLSTGRQSNLEDLEGEGRLTFVQGDVRDPIAPQLEQVGVEPTDVDYAYHLASRASPTDFEEYPLDIAETNSTGTKTVLEFARDNDARVIYASTSEVYGEPEVHPQTESYRGNVNIRGKRSCYDESKRLGETYCEIFHRKHGVDVRTARIFNTYGPRMRADDGRVIPTFVTQALKGDDLTVYGDGSQTRSFLYVSDQIEALSRLMSEPGLENGVVNIGSTEEITINQLAESIVDLVDGDVSIRYEPLPEDDPSKRRPSIGKAETELDWSPSVELEAGLTKTIARFREKLQH